MTVNRPYKRTCRQFVNGRYAGEYMLHPKDAQAPEHYVRAFLLLLKDLQELFDYIEPADKNLSCYSYRVHSLLLRAWVEVEANCKAILREHGYSKAGDLKMADDKKINQTHLLSQFQVKAPTWSGSHGTRTPFGSWSSGGSLPWYQAYNATKHDRYSEFEEATFGHLIDACCGVLVLLSAQFETNDFTPRYSVLGIDDGPNDGMESGIGGYFRVKFPNWPKEERYEFDWQALQQEADPFQEIDYSKIP
jgi:hypothetical protein